MTVPSSSASASFCDDFPHDKVILAGNCGVGKTTLFLRFKEREFVEDIRPGTVAEQQRQWQRDGVDISMTLYDTAGVDTQMEYNQNNPNTPTRINTVYFRKARAIIFVYDITDQDSFEALVKWDDEIHKYGIRKTDNVIKAIVGTKKDMEDDRAVRLNRAKSFAENKDISDEFVFEVSSKTGEGVQEMFDAIGKAMVPGGYSQPRPVQSKCSC